MALSGVRSSWLMLARKLDWLGIGLFGAGFFLGVFFGEVGQFCRFAVRGRVANAQIVDGGDLPFLAFDELLLRAA